jgi:hypothetical protein
VEIVRRTRRPSWARRRAWRPRSRGARRARRARGEVFGAEFGAGGEGAVSGKGWGWEEMKDGRRKRREQHKHRSIHAIRVMSLSVTLDARPPCANRDSLLTHSPCALHRCSPSSPPAAQVSAQEKSHALCLASAFLPVGTSLPQAHNSSRKKSRWSRVVAWTLPLGLPAPRVAAPKSRHHMSLRADSLRTQPRPPRTSPVVRTSSTHSTAPQTLLRLLSQLLLPGAVPRGTTHTTHKRFAGYAAHAPRCTARPSWGGAFAARACLSIHRPMPIPSPG